MISGLTGCGDLQQKQSSNVKDVADCHYLFNGDNIYVNVGGYRGSLSVYQDRGLRIGSIDVGQGLEAACGRSDVIGSIAYSYIPFTADYTMKLSLTSASCGDRTIEIKGDCESHTSASAELDGASGYISK
jgi:hypothetical protein